MHMLPGPALTERGVPLRNHESENALCAAAIVTRILAAIGRNVVAARRPTSWAE